MEGFQVEQAVWKVGKAPIVIRPDCSLGLLGRGSWAVAPAALSFIPPVVSGVTSEFGVISINIPSITISGNLKLLGFFCSGYFSKIKLKIILESTAKIIYWYTDYFWN